MGKWAMIRITNADFHKLIKLLAKDGQEGATLTFYTSATNGSSILIKTVDRLNKDMVIEISDIEYPFMPRVTKTETF